MDPGTRLRVLRGNPTLQEMVAVVLAVDVADAEDAEAPRPTPAWRIAARLESVGHGSVVAASDLEAARRRPWG